MNKNYVIAIVIVIVVIVGGIFLLKSDGTENVVIDTHITEGDVSHTHTGTSTEELPINENGDTSDEAIEEPQLEGDGDEAGADMIATDLEEVAVVERVVTYTSAGFDPKVIEIEAGESVKFVNGSNRKMWVASNVHPTHTLYPEESDADCLGSSFDACEEIEIGGSWSFIFNKVGDWEYHDHLNPSRTGTVEVN